MTSTLELDLKPLIENKRWKAVTKRLAKEKRISEASGIKYHGIVECIRVALVEKGPPPPLYVLLVFLKVCPDATRRATEIIARCALRHETANDLPANILNFFMAKYPTLFLTSLQQHCQQSYLVVLPIHVAALVNASTDVMRFLLRSYPEGAQQKNHYAALPLHYAALNASLEIVNRLIDAYPDGLRQKDKGGRLPIHVAATKCKSLEVINRFIEAYPDGLRQPDEYGRLPIHRAALEDSTVPLEVIKRLIDAYPEGVQKRDASGQLPIHLAARFHTSVDGIRVLCDAYPMSIFLISPNPMLSYYSYYENMKNALPTEHAYLANFSDEVISYLENEEKRFIVDLAHIIVERNHRGDA